MDLNIKEKNILITGAAKGIGRGIAIAAAKEGATIILHYRESEVEARETAKLLRDYGVKVALIKGDLVCLEDVQKMKILIEREVGTVDCIVNNAGWAQFKSFFNYQPEEWRREVDVCFYGVLHLVHTFLPDMMKKNQGKFINIVGDSARTGDRNLILSSAARGGTISFLKSLSQEVGKHNIQCNTVALGMIEQEQSSFDAASIEKMLRQYPLRRLGKVDDVAGIVLFLLSSWSDWITGQVISINGGYSMIG